jgi:ElaB/YqjD/DUF883 family membrane-anchored ribosome-binding protein
MNVRNLTEPVKSQIIETWQDARDNVTETARDVSKATDRYVRRNPWKAMAVVALAACMVGYLLSYARK